MRFVVSTDGAAFERSQAEASARSELAVGVRARLGRLVTPMLTVSRPSRPVGLTSPLLPCSSVDRLHANGPSPPVRFVRGRLGCVVWLNGASLTLQAKATFTTAGQALTFVLPWLGTPI